MLDIRIAFTKTRTAEVTTPAAPGHIARVQRYHRPTWELQKSVLQNGTWLHDRLHVCQSEGHAYALAGAWLQAVALERQRVATPTQEDTFPEDHWR